MALADSILTGYDPTKVLLQTFGTLAKANNERHQLELLAKKNEQDAILEAAAMELKGRIFQMNLKESGVQMKNTYSLIAERERRTDQANAIADKEEMFNSRLQSLSPDGRSFITILETGTPEEKEVAWDKWNKVKQESIGFDSDGIRRAITQIEGTTFAKAKLQLQFEKEQARQREAEGKAGRDERRVATGEKNAETSATRAGNQMTLAEQVRADRLAKEAARKGGDAINFPASIGGGRVTEAEAKIKLGKALLNPNDSTAQADAKLLKTKLGSMEKRDSYSGKAIPSPYTPEILQQWALEGAEIIKGGPSLPSLPTDPESKPSMEAPLTPDELPSLESMRDLFPGVKKRKPSASTGFGGFGFPA